MDLWEVVGPQGIPGPAGPIGPAGPAFVIFSGGTHGTLVNNQGTLSVSLVYQSSVQFSDTTVRFVPPVDGTLTELHVDTTDDVSGGNYGFNVRANGESSDLDCTITPGAHQCSDTASCADVSSNPAMEGTSLSIVPDLGSVPDSTTGLGVYVIFTPGAMCP